MSLFPIFLKLAARPCVVIGAGNIAESKIESLLVAEAHLTVIAPEALPRVREWAKSGELTWYQREYRQGDLAGAFLVVAATATASVNRAAYAEANAGNILCNAVDDPPFCDYYFPSVVRRGELQIAISTAGESPALAQRLRKEINAQLPLDTGAWLMELGRLRREVTAVEPVGEDRKLLLHELAQREVCGYTECPLADASAAALSRSWLLAKGGYRIVTKAKKGAVYLVGAGPGDPELLTLRALRLLETADVIFHDDLVTDEVLAFVHRHALVTSVGKRCGQPRITQAGIHALMIESARAGQSVVRLKSGDPLVFGRAGEEIAALREAGVPFEIVPGVTAALAAGAALSLPLTDRRRASKLIFCTGHHAAGKEPSKPIWAGPLPEDATLVIYMPGRDTGRIAAELADAGVAADVPCCAISDAATPRQSYAASTLEELPTLACGPAPLLLLVGRAMGSLLEGEALGEHLRLDEKQIPHDAQDIEFIV